MPWRLIAFLIVLTIVVLFAGFNITNVSNISFGFYTLTKVPVFLSLFVAFLLGAVLVLPFAVRPKRVGNRSAKGTSPKSRETIQDGNDMSPATVPVEPEPPTEPPPKKRAKK